jgi:methylglyoxal synthase
MVRSLFEPDGISGPYGAANRSDLLRQAHFGPDRRFRLARFSAMLDQAQRPVGAAAGLDGTVALELKPRKRIGLVAHDNKKQDLVEWARFNRGMLAKHDLVATGTTGTMLGRELDLPVTCLQSGPLGGDLQIGAMIADGTIDFLVFFWDPLEPQPHDTDVKSLLRIAVVWNIPVACDRASADFMISSPLMTGSYQRTVPDYTAHNDREIPRQEEPDEDGGEVDEGDRAAIDPALGSTL